VAAILADNLEAIMELIKRLSDIEPGAHLVIVPPNIEGEITGISYARIAKNGRAKATYADGTTKPFKVPKEYAARIHEITAFNICSFVSNYARK